MAVMRFDPGGDPDCVLHINALSDELFRLNITKAGQDTGSGLNRYGFLKEDWEYSDFQQKTSGKQTFLETNKALFSLRGNKEPVFALKDSNERKLCEGKIKILHDEGIYEVSLGLDKNEKFFGLGDQCRDRIEHRNSIADMDVVSAASYIPIPFLMSSRGYGILVNTTHRHVWDIDHKNRNTLRIVIPGGNLDLYFFYGPGLKDLLGAYTLLTGRPALPPKWSFGLWFICRTQANDFEVASNALNFRDRKIPCDVLSLEPGWMGWKEGDDYDYSTEKKWNSEDFPIPSWAPNGPYNLIDAIKRMGFKMGLWLCQEYDLSYEAERRIGGIITSQSKRIEQFLGHDFEEDVHFSEPATADNFTKPEKAWFDHLKKFVDQGISFFKQDGAMQVCEHPGRIWANGMADAEMHNLQPLLYSQQMYEGFRQHTGKRPCCFTPAGWAGVQRYTGTWTGDTGGGAKTLVACLNLAMSGHSTVTCDMEVTTKEGIHYGFFLPWAQVNSWTYFRHPWLLGDELQPIFCDYANLRSRLVPYIYTYAHVAHTTGIPTVRPIVLEYPNDPKTTSIITQWFFGKELLVSSFSEDVYLPEGKWLDYWNGKIYIGPQKIKYKPPENRGGGMFLRSNSILPLGPLVQYVGQKTEEGFALKIFIDPGKKAAFEIYDDDGVSFDYTRGKYSLHKITAAYSKGSISLKAPKAVKIDQIEIWTNEKPEKVLLNGKAIDGEWLPEFSKFLSH